MKRDVCILIGAALILNGATMAPRIEIWNAAELQIAVGKLNVLGSVLYIAAHPDDENTSVLAYLSKGKKYRTAYLSLTRGTEVRTSSARKRGRKSASSGPRSSCRPAGSTAPNSTSPGPSTSAIPRPPRKPSLSGTGRPCSPISSG